MAEIANALISGLQAGQQAGEDRRRRNALSQAGQAYAAGDTSGAMNALVSAGMPQEAAQYSALDEARRANAARTAAQQAVTNLGADASAADQAHAAAGAYMGAGDFDHGLQLTQAWQQLDAGQRQQVAQTHDAIASFALGQIQRGVPADQRAADAAAHAQDFSAQTGIPIDQVQQMIQHQTDWSDNGLKALAAEHRSASDQLQEMTRQSERQEDITRQTRQFNAQLAATTARNAPQMDHETIVYQAAQYRATGKLPPLGMGAQAAASRNAILAEATRQAAAEGSTAEADVIRQRALSANSQALNQITRQRAQVLQFENTAERNLNLALEASARVQRTGSPILNSILQQARLHGTGDPSATQLETAVNSFVEEYAKVMSGSTGGAAATDSARAQAHAMMNTGMTIPQIQAAAQQMTAEMGNRRAALNAQQDELLDTMHSPMLGSGSRPQSLPVIGATGQTNNLRFNAGSINTLRQQLQNGTLNQNFITTEEAQRAIAQWDQFNHDAADGENGGGGNSAPTHGPAVGSVQRGADGHQYRFKGGNPNDRNSWEQIDNRTIQGVGGAQRPL